MKRLFDTLRRRHSSRAPRPSSPRGVLLLLLAPFLLGLASVRTRADSNPPDRLVYQGYLVDGSGNVVAAASPANFDISFRIYNHATSSQEARVLWAENQTVTVDKGNFSVVLGNGAALTGTALGAGKHDSLNSLFKGNDVGGGLYIGITASAISTTEITPRLQFLAAPLAFLAQRANSLVKPDGSAGATLSSAGTLTASTFSGQFSGDGANVTSLNANNITSGTLDTTNRVAGLPASKLTGSQNLPDGVLSANVARRNVANTFAANNTFNNQINASGGVTSAGDITVTGTAKFSGNGTIPIGGIIMWSGTNIPDGWVLCDGHNNTPNLISKFIMGGDFSTSGATRINSEGGESTVTLGLANIPNHAHTFDDYVLPLNDRAVGNNDNTQGWSYVSPSPGIGSAQIDNNNDRIYYRNNIATSAVGGKANGATASFSITPPYYVLAFIMRKD